MLCLSLDLPDPLPRDLELVAEHSQGGGAPIVETVAAYQHVPMTLGEPLDSFLKEEQLHLAYDLASCIGDALIFDEFFNLRAILSDERISSSLFRSDTVVVMHITYFR